MKICGNCGLPIIAPRWYINDPKQTEENGRYIHNPSEDCATALAGYRSACETVLKDSLALNKLFAEQILKERKL